MLYICGAGGAKVLGGGTGRMVGEEVVDGCDAFRQMDSRSNPEVTRSNTRPMDVSKYSDS
jgi:hypothetical protein